MANPLQSILPKDPESKSDPNGMAGKNDMMRQADIALHQPRPVATPERPAGISPKDRVNPTGGYGDKPGEKRIDVGPMIKPLGQMHKGGTVPKTGPYIMKKDEKVLTPEDHSKLKNAMSLAQAALSHDDAEPQDPPKVIRAMNIRKASDGSHVIEHHHVHFSHPMEEHTAKNMDELHDHLEQHWGGPNDGEAASESEKDESPGVAAAEKAIGLEK